jgi:hypothetical protein
MNETAPQGLPDSIAQCHVGSASLDPNKAQETGPGRYLVRFERRGTRLLDKDNLYGSVKWGCDALRYFGIIPDDDPTSIELEVTQTKVKKDQVETVIEVTRL